MKKSLLVIILIVAFNFSSAQSQVKFFNDKSQSTIVYSMHHPLHDWQGTCKDVASVILTDGQKADIQSVAVSAKVASFDSDNANRDSHMIEVTEALLYPTVTFTSSAIKKDGDKLIMTGNLTFHGVSKPVSVQANVKDKGDKIEVTGGFDIAMTDFKIEPPSLLGINTDNDIRLDFDILF